MKMCIIYWSGTGNTEAMANLICEGAVSTGADVLLKEVAAASAADVETADIAVFGCPAMGDEILEEDEFEPFMQSVAGALSGRKVGLFGSYDWGDGEWMRLWEDDVKKAGAVLLKDGLIVNLEPAGDDVENCRNFGKELAGM
ncbi:Flavodoxin [Methanimicrococcus sp. At1]|uniref:Flavodoxin n=1 Tax=Methanimicrococcus hacksteinii TaxID=3028293 RepID=A0ABU3VPP7_9EURY|nr:flavodoxin [Methanimicrococcus sp. At1]MDV0445380.1 Flavodoxin [Methanimicrococcus sp. At1]